MTEHWRDVVGWVGLYQVSDAGRVRGLRRIVTRRDGTQQTFQARQMALPVSSKGYPCVRFSDVERRRMLPVHRLAALAFLGQPPDGKPEVNHIDGNKQNNRVENLEWVSAYGNRKHAWDTGLRTRSHLPILIGAKQNLSKLTDAIVIELREQAKSGATIKGLARKHGVHPKTISDAVRGRTWKHLPLPPTETPA